MTQPPGPHDYDPNQAYVVYQAPADGTGYSIRPPVGGFETQPPAAGYGPQQAPGGYGAQLPPGSYGAQLPPGGYGAQPPPGGYGLPIFVQQAGYDPLISPDYAGWWRRATAVLKSAWRHLAALQALGFLVSLLFIVPQSIYSMSANADLQNANRIDPTTGAPVTPDLTPALAVLGWTVLGGFLAMLVTFLVTIACNHVAVSVAAGVRPQLGAALSLAGRRLFPLFGWQLLAGLIVLLGFCACVLPSIYLAAVFAILPAVVTFERGGSAISRCFTLFHRDVGAAVGRIATIFGIAVAAGVVGVIVSAVVSAFGSGASDFSTTRVSTTAVSTTAVVAAVIGGVLADLIGRITSIVTAPLTLCTYADLRSRVEPLTTAMLAASIGLAPADSGEWMTPGGFAGGAWTAPAGAAAGGAAGGAAAAGAAWTSPTADAQWAPPPVDSRAADPFAGQTVIGAPGGSQPADQVSYPNLGTGASADSPTVPAPGGGHPADPQHGSWPSADSPTVPAPGGGHPADPAGHAQHGPGASAEGPTVPAPGDNQWAGPGDNQWTQSPPDNTPADNQWSTPADPGPSSSPDDGQWTRPPND